MSDGGTCLRCGYDLTGLDDRRPCPECGLLAGLSRQSESELRHNQPRWLAALRAGALCVAIGMALVLAMPSGYAMLDTAVEGVWDRAWEQAAATNAAPAAWAFTLGDLAAAATLEDWVWILAAIGLLTLGPLTLATGVYLLTRPRRRGAAVGWAGWLCRALSLPPIAAGILATMTDLIVLGIVRLPWQSLNWVFFYTLLTAWVGGGVLAILLSLRLRVLARRAPAPLLAADSPIVGAVLGGTMLVGIAWMTLSMTKVLPRIPPQSTLYAVTTTIAITLLAVGATAALWSAYLLFRYALAFATTRRQALQIFADADRAAVA